MNGQTGNILLSGVRTSTADLTTHMQSIHAVISSRYPFIDRMAIAIYDAPTDMLKTFVSSERGGGTGLKQYQTRLDDVPSLAQLARNRQSRLVHDISHAFGAATTHTGWLKEAGYRSSYTVPVYNGDALAAFVFFDSRQLGAFDAEVGRFLDVFATLISQLYLMELKLVHGLVGTVHIASGLACIRDLETGQHLERMANYSRLIGRGLADACSLRDEYIEYLHLFAPLHDIGKVGIPDAVLLKPGKLDADEWIVMRRHVEIGERIIDQMAQDMGLGDTLATSVMRNIVACHHERGDGSGYPRGLAMDDIPLEARIVAVADVYDALSNRRPYKPAWGEGEVVAELQREVESGRLDADCVRVLIDARQQREDIRQRFCDEEPSAKD